MATTKRHERRVMTEFLAAISSSYCLAGGATSPSGFAQPRERRPAAMAPSQRGSLRSEQLNMTVLRAFITVRRLAVFAMLAVASAVHADTVNTRERQVSQLAPGIYM